jgi:hypothetical protein
VRLEWVDPANRFDTVSFSNEVIDGRSLPPTAAYGCPRCAQHVEFRCEHFERASRKTNLDEATAAALDIAANSRGHGALRFVDWQCPGCDLVVRAYVRTWAGGRHGDGGADIVEVVEGW